MPDGETGNESDLVAGGPGLLGRLERVDPRTVWASEERDFTPWLLKNADYLAEALGIDIELDANEHPVGLFELDLLGRDVTNGGPLIVENQLEPTDHRHLGQVMTYAAGTDASTVIWIATRFNEQHRQAITWLNERTGEETNFFAIELELVKIGSSAPAPNLKVVAAPNEWQKRARDARRASQATSGKGALYTEFWASLVERLAQERPAWTRRRTATNPNNWLSMPCPVPGSQFVMGFGQGGRLRHEIYIDDGASADANLEVFRGLEANRADLEAAYGRTLEFDDLSGKRACRVADYTEGDVSVREKHSEYVDWFIDSGDRFRRALARIPESEYSAHRNVIDAAPATSDETASAETVPHVI